MYVSFLPLTASKVEVLIEKYYKNSLQFHAGEATKADSVKLQTENDLQVT